MSDGKDSSAYKKKNREELETDPQGKSRRNMLNRVKQWKGFADFWKAQLQVVGVLLVAYVGNNWRYSYPRNDNHSYAMFWTMNGALLVAALFTLKHENNGNVQLLSRSQTEEWKGWMQWAFIMYHYYRAYNVYNEIRVFVSSYVWMTGFGNFLYFDKKQDFSVERAVSMWLRINYFPLLLSVFIGVPLDLFYIVPLHTAAFFITMATCFAAAKLFDPAWPHWKRNGAALAACLGAHILFYETPLVNTLLIFGKEIHFRFQSDKYSAVLGIISGYFWNHAQKFAQWAHTPSADPPHTSTTGSAGHHYYYTHEQKVAIWGQRAAGVALLALWWTLFGHIGDKFAYNPVHPFVFWMPIAGWLALRNGSKYLTEVHSTALEFFGKITLETYVLQFHVFMCRNVQHIPIVVPGSGPNGSPVLKLLNMLLTGAGFVLLAHWARQITVTTQTTVTDLVVLLRKGPALAPPPPPDDDNNGGDNDDDDDNDNNDETVPLNSNNNNKDATTAGNKSNSISPPISSSSNSSMNNGHNKVLHAKESGEV